MRPWQSWHSSWWGPRGLRGEEIASMGVPNIAGWFILVRGKMENPGGGLFMFVQFVLAFFPPMSVFPAGSNAIPWAEVKWIWAPKRCPHVTSSQAQECLSATVDCLPALKHLVPLRWQVIFVGRRLGDDLQTCQMGKDSIKYQTGRKFSVSEFRNNRNNFLIGVGHLPMHHDLMEGFCATTYNGDVICGVPSHLTRRQVRYRVWPFVQRWSLFGPGQLGTFKRAGGQENNCR